MTCQHFEGSESPLSDSLTHLWQEKKPNKHAQKQLCSDQRSVFDLNVHLTVEFPPGREAHHPILFPPSAIHTRTHTPLQFTRWHTHAYTQSGNAGENSPHLLLPHSLVSSPRFNGCAAKARLPPPMSHNYLLTAQTNRATQRVTSNQNCHRWLSLVIKSARPLYLSGEWGNGRKRERRGRMW